MVLKKYIHMHTAKSIQKTPTFFNKIYKPSVIDKRAQAKKVMARVKGFIILIFI